MKQIINPNPPLPPLDPMNSNNNQSSSDDNRAGRFASGFLAPLVTTALGGLAGAAIRAPILGSIAGEAVGSGISNSLSPEIEKYGQKAWNATKDAYNTFINTSIQADNYCKQVYPTPASLCEDPASYKFSRRIK